MPIRVFLICFLIAATIAVGGCARFQAKKTISYTTVESSSSGNSKAARRRFDKALLFMEAGDLKRAEQCLQEALLADVSFGPAHNALGKVYYDQEKYYLAAWEFEHAIKTMPDRPEPINNLGLVYEAVDRLDDAIVQYEQASALDTESAQYLGNLLRAKIRRGDPALPLKAELERLVFLDDRREWVDWAKEKIVFAESKSNVDTCNQCASDPYSVESTPLGIIGTPYVDSLPIESSDFKPQ